MRRSPHRVLSPRLVGTGVMLSVAAIALSAPVMGAGPQARDGYRVEQYCRLEDPECAATAAVIRASAPGFDLEIRDAGADAARLQRWSIAELPATVVTRDGAFVAAILGPRSPSALRAELSALRAALDAGPLPRRARLLRTDRAAQAQAGTVLAVDVHYRAGGIEITGGEVFVGAAPRARRGSRHSHVVQLRDAAGRVLYTRPWDIERTIMPPPPQPGEPAAGPVELLDLRTTLILPYIPAATSAHILRPYGVEAATFAVERASGPVASDEFPEAAATPVYTTGRDAQRLVVLFMGDAYRSAADKRRYPDDVDAHLEFLLDTKPFSKKRIANNINIYRAATTKGLKCEHDCGGTPRLICCDNRKVNRAAAKARIPFDEIVVLYNHPDYGGSGGAAAGGGGPETYAVAYNRHGWDDDAPGPSGGRPEPTYFWGREVMVHEFGHSWAGLMDEYEYGTAGNIWGPNCSTSPCTWKGGGLGCWDGCSYFGLFRPTENHCLMRSLTPSHGKYEFCKVGQRQIKSVAKRY